MTGHRTAKRLNANALAGIFIAAVVVVIIVIAWNACHADRSSSTPRLATQTDSLLIVRVPSVLDQQIIDYPGFTVSFNPTHHQPNYSAWCLTAEHLNGDVARRDKFATDSDVPGSATPDDYKRSGYDRGHMAPAGDMKWSRDAMDACFFMTNISPQHHDLNTRAWKKLEEKCRRWAMRDSVIIIICGPILTDHLTQTIGRTPVTVPERFFKVVLAPYANPPRAIGFVMPNGYVPGGMQQTAMSVDQVEAITGMDFFSSLPDDIENKVEADGDLRYWN